MTHSDKTPNAGVHPLPRWSLAIVGVLSVVMALAAGAMIVAAVAAPRVVWVLAGFEVMTVLGGVIGFLFARGRFQEAQGLALACVAGTFLTTSFLPWLATRQGGVVFAEGGHKYDLATWMLVRVGVAFLIGAMGAYAVLRRDPRSRFYAIRAAAAGVPLVGIAAGLYLGRDHMSTWNLAVKWGLTGLGGLAACVLLCAAAHCTIRAFECGRTDERPT